MYMPEDKKTRKNREEQTKKKENRKNIAFNKINSCNLLFAQKLKDEPK